MAGDTQSAKHHKKSHHHVGKIIGIVTAALVVVGLVVVSIVWLRNNPSGGDTPEQEEQAATDDAIRAAEKLKVSKDFDQAAEEASNQYNKATDTEQKYILALQTASAFESKGDCQAGLEWYQTANGIKPDDRAALSGMARCYDDTGDYAKAAEFYQKTIDSIDTDVTGADNDVAYYQSLLDAAKAKMR